MTAPRMYVSRTRRTNWPIVARHYIVKRILLFHRVPTAEYGSARGTALGLQERDAVAAKIGSIPALLDAAENTRSIAIV